MSIWDSPDLKTLKAIRDSGYDGPLDQNLSKDVPLEVAEALDALRRSG